jgi:hypothetical protein
MHTYSAITLFCRIFLLILLTASINGKFGHAQVVQTSRSSAQNRESFATVSAMHADKKTAHEHHKHSGECYTCCNCLCHVILSVQSIKLDYNPVIMSFCSFKPITNLPEIILSRFIPPRALL